MKHYCIKVYGKVQGVFFRDSTRKKAGELALTGFVRNEPDGSVYIEVEGEDIELEKFVSWCNAGPSNAKVEHVEIRESSIKIFKDFKISRF